MRRNSKPHVQTQALVRASDTAAEAQKHEYQRLWLSLTRTPWLSLVLVPADPEVSAADVATSLADVGSHLTNTRVSAITAAKIEYDSAYALSDVQLWMKRERGTPQRPSGADRVIDVYDEQDRMLTEGQNSVPELASPDIAQLIISIPSVLTDPLGVAVTRNADVIVLCVQLGKTRITDARRTLELIGEDRVAGCFVVR